MKSIDCRGLKSLKGIRLVKKYFNSIGEGEAEVLIDNDISRENIIKYAMRRGYHVIEKDDSLEVIIEKRGCLEVLEEEKKLVILITTDRLGEGNDTLGHELMVKYFEALSDSDNLPSKIIFLNSAIKFLIEGTSVKEYINLLIERGVDIYVSELSLKYYDASDKLILGNVIEMEDIVEMMNLADDFIKI